jgi:hypothetical protein
MSSKINITIGDQRLLQEAKTRGAANQQALDSRQQNAKTAADAAKAAEPEQPPRRNGIPEPKVDRRPAAQTKKKETTGFIGLSLPSPRVIDGTRVTESKSWQQYYVSAGTWATRTKFNGYSLSTITVQPYLEKKTKNQNTFTVQSFSGFTSYTRTSSIESLEWTVRDQISSSIAGGTRISNPPPFTQNPALLNLIRQQKVVTSCTDTHVYYSIFIRVYEPSSAILTAYSTNNSYFSRDDSGRIQFYLNSGLTGGNPFYLNFFTFSAGAFIFLLPFLALSGQRNTFNYFDLAIYAKCSIKEKTIQTRYLTISELAEADPVFSPYAKEGRLDGAYYYFYANLDSDDPHYTLFQNHLNNYSSPSNAKRNGYLYNPSRWPSSLSFNKKTGKALIIANAPAGYTGSRRSLLTRNFAPNTSYGSILGTLGGATTFITPYLEARDFTFVEDYNISTGNSLYDFVFPFLLSNG